MGTQTAVRPGEQTNAEFRFTALVVDDDPLSIEYVRGVLHDFPLDIIGEADLGSALQAARRLQPALIFLDLFLDRHNGLEVMSRFREAANEARVVMMTAHYSTESAVRAIQDGATDYLNKPIPIPVLRSRVEGWLQEERQHLDLLRLESALADGSQFEGIVGRNPALRELCSKLWRVAPHYSTALVTGETGTGKELIARALHALSRPKGPFIVCNCAAVVDTLFESELFGSAKGAYTGAGADRPGLAEAAERGTLFLDEVGEVPQTLQAKLLRLLQNREVRRVGGSTTRTVDIRIVAATNRDLRSMVAEERFRDDLYYRLSTVHMKLPPLRERREDLPLLVRHFLGAFANRAGRPTAKLTRRAEALVLQHTWPGNVRELENALSYAAMLAEGGLIDTCHFPDYLLAPTAERDPTLRTLAEVEREHALAVLQKCNGNRQRAAEVLGISRATLYRLLPR